MNNAFFERFLMISNVKTLVFIVILIALFFVIHLMAQRKVSFAKRVTVAMLLGLLLGIFIQMSAGFPDVPGGVVFVKEVSTWYGLFGNGFLSLIRMLVVPLVMVSVVHVIVTMQEGMQIRKLLQNTIVIPMIMVAISAAIGLTLGILFDIGTGITVEKGIAEIKPVSSVVSTLSNLLPSNPAKAMVDLNVIALVVFSIFIGLRAKTMHRKHQEVIQPFYDLINAFHKIIMSIAISIIKLMPYAVIPLSANTIASHGLAAMLAVGKFILVLYLAIVIMFIVQLIALLVFGISPVHYLKKSFHVMVLAFTSRSSVGTLPVTIDTLTGALGVNNGTASFVASFGTTAGMQGCAGVFPALLIVFVANMSGTVIDVTFISMTIVVISLGSLGIAGIPGTATMAASVSLSGMGMAAFFPFVSPILAIDPLIDMGRTWLNVSGSMVNALIVDKTLGQLDDAVLVDEQFLMTKRGLQSP